MLPKIIIRSGAFKSATSHIREVGKKCVIVTDSHLKIPAEELHKKLRGAGIKAHVIMLPPGETTKSFGFVEKIANSLMKVGMKRDSCLVALGGGVVGDITGFVASIFMRGIPFISIPTTLLAMADSSIGGKTGIDLGEGKNLIGSFYHPEVIIIDPTFLKTLPDKEFRGGMAEIVKHSIIADRRFFIQLEKGTAKILNRNPATLEKILKKSAAIKLKFVKADERESLKKTSGGKSRMALNYGHTVGHALEKVSKFNISHGDAVSIGMVAENRLAVGKKLLTEEDSYRILQLLKEFKLPTKIPEQYRGVALQKALTLDKKNIGGKLFFALPSGIGKVKITHL